MANIAIIPARGGSKRIPGKNIKPFHGRPIISYAIDAALQSGVFVKVLVSTDSEEIGHVAKQYGAQVPFFRSSENADDHAGMAHAVVETLERLKELGETYDSVCCLFATGPFITSTLIQDGYQQLQNSGADSVIAVQKNSHPIMRSLTLSDGGRLSLLWTDHHQSRSQDLATTYHDAAQMYWATTAGLMERCAFYSDKSAAIVLGELDAHDIDTPEDWGIAERLWHLKQSSGIAP